jgi:hypothetical protein
MKILPAFLLLAATGALAQQTPHLAYVYPAGGRAGSTFQIVVGGQYLQTVSNAFITGGGIQAAFEEDSRPMNFNDFATLRDRFRALQQKLQASRRPDPGTNVWTTADTTEMEEIRAKILKNPPNRTANPAMIDSAVVKVSINTNAAPGEHEIRLASRNALSNPLKFFVGGLNEISKPVAHPANPDLERFLEQLGRKATPPGTPKYEARISLPATLNGQIMPGGVDRYHFSATRGQQLILSASARALIPYIADAVPGWFEATLTILDSKGGELVNGERFRFRPDPVIHFTVPHDGEYTVEVHDSIFRGREDFIYRLSIGELPYVTGIFPLGGRAGEKTSVLLTGWNLQQTNLVRDNAGLQPGVAMLTGNFFNPVPFAVDDLPECLEREANHSAETAQAVTLPIIINGRISQPGRIGVFKFQGRAGEQIVAEAFARRLDSPLDSFLRLTDARGTQLAFNDDFEDKGSGLETHHADSYFTAKLPADGTYFVHISDAQGHGGPEYGYRLRISEPRPDFALRVVPSSLAVRAGTSVPVTVYVLRKDGFTNAIDLRLKDAPAGFTLSGARVPENQDKAQFTLKAPPEAGGEMLNLALEGRAGVAGRIIAHAATPAEDLMQAFFYRHLVPARELEVMVAENPRPFALSALKVLSSTPVKIPTGGSAHVRISTPSPAFTNRFRLELQGAPDGISLDAVSPVENGIEVVVAADLEKIKPGAKGNLIFDILQNNPGTPPAQTRPAAQTRRVVVGTLPAIPFTVIAD